VEREMIVEALKSARGNMAEAARKLGISERIMGLRVARFRVDLEKLRRTQAAGRIISSTPALRERIPSKPDPTRM
jgi:transposase-like protein